MQSEDYFVSRYDNAIMLLPNPIRMSARKLARDERAAAEEIRLRIGRKPTVLINDSEISFSDEEVTERDLYGVIELATRASAHTYGDMMRSGYITAIGGYRIGICGTVGTEHGKDFGFRKITSLNIRISKEIIGCSNEILPLVTEQGMFLSTLIVSPPGFGKTTLLRDLIRNLSNGNSTCEYRPFRVAVCDDRGEIGGSGFSGLQMDLGLHTDILEGCKKSEGIINLLRSMNPQIIALDEISEEKDIEAIEKASYCGTLFLATAHAFSENDLKMRSVYKKLLEQKVFKRAVFIIKDGNGRSYKCINPEERDV